MLLFAPLAATALASALLLLDAHLEIASCVARRPDQLLRYVIVLVLLLAFLKVVVCSLFISFAIASPAAHSAHTTLALVEQENDANCQYGEIDCSHRPVLHTVCLKIGEVARIVPLIDCCCILWPQVDYRFHRCSCLHLLLLKVFFLLVDSALYL